jgi:hypothetical protein
MLPLSRPQPDRGGAAREGRHDHHDHNDHKCNVVAISE